MLIVIAMPGAGASVLCTFLLLDHACILTLVEVKEIWQGGACEGTGGSGFSWSFFRSAQVFEISSSFPLRTAQSDCKLVLVICGLSLVRPLGL